jgi:hypothetical protein
MCLARGRPRGRGGDGTSGGRLLLEFGDNQGSWAIDDEFMFDRDLLVAPVLENGARERWV